MKVFEQIKGMPVVNAIEFLDQHTRLPEDNMEHPEVAAFLGLVFGYKPCDIDYYVRTRCFNETKHSLEKKAIKDKPNIIMCRDCSLEIINGDIE